MGGEGRSWAEKLRFAQFLHPFTIQRLSVPSSTPSDSDEQSSAAKAAAAALARPIRRGNQPLKKGQAQRAMKKLNEAMRAGESALNRMGNPALFAEQKAKLLEAERQAIEALENGADFSRMEGFGEQSLVRRAINFGWLGLTAQLLLRMTRKEARMALRADDPDRPNCYPFTYVDNSELGERNGGSEFKRKAWDLLEAEGLIAPRAPAPKNPAQTPWGRTPLQMALEMDAMDACQWLRERGADFAVAGWRFKAGEWVAQNAAQWAVGHGSQRAAAYAQAVLDESALAQALGGESRDLPDVSHAGSKNASQSESPSARSAPGLSGRRL